MPQSPPKRSPTALDLEVGRRLRQARIAAGLSQTALADAVGVTFQQVQRYETGVNRISPGKLAVAAKLFGKHIS